MFAFIKKKKKKKKDMTYIKTRKMELTSKVFAICLPTTKLRVPFVSLCHHTQNAMYTANKEKNIALKSNFQTNQATAKSLFFLKEKFWKKLLFKRTKR